MSGGNGKLMEVDEGFGGQGRRLCHPFSQRAKVNVNFLCNFYTRWAWRDFL